MEMKTGKLLTCLLTMTTLATALPIHAAALIGDLNNDGVVDKQDAKILSEYFAGYPHDIDTVTADVNADGKLTRQDGMILNRYADGWDGYEIANVYYNENGDINIIDGVISTEIVESCDDAIVALENVKEKLEIDEPAEELVAAGSNSTEYLNSYTLQQTYEGIPVCGRSITVVTGKDGIADYVNSGYLKDISVSTEPTFSETEAWALINETYGESDENFYDGLQIFSLYEYETEPVLTHAFYVESTCEYVFVSAYDGSIVDTFSTCAPDSEPVNASGTDERGVNREFSVELRKGLFGNIKNYELSSDERNISVYHATDGLYESEDNNWEDTSAVSAYANVCVVYDWYAKEFNQNGFYDDGKIEVYVHSKETKDNAETVYRPKKEFDIITFFENGYKYGVGNPTTASSLDIVAHEFTHGVFFYKACGKKALGICSKGLLGAINEAYADTMSMIFNRNWIHGSDLTQNKSYMRNAIDPYENKCPKYYGDVYWTDPTNMDSDNGGVHDNSCVISHAAYLMYEKMSDLGVWNDDEIYSLLGDLWYNSMACGYNADSTFATVRLNVVKTAQKLGWNASDIKNIIEAAFDEVNVSSDPNEICDGFCEVLLDIKTTHENTNQKPNYCISLHNNGSISTFDLSDKTSLIVKKSVSTIEIYDSPNWSYFGVNTGYTTGEHRGYVIDLDLSDKTSIKLHDLRFAPLLELSCNYTFDNTTIDKITWKENGTAASDTTLILDDGCYFINIPRYLPDSTYDITLYNNGNVICELHDIEVKSKNTGGYYIELDDYISKYYSYRLTAHAIDSATGDGISNATIRLSFVDSTGTTTATSDPFTLSNIGIDMYFNTDSVYNTAIVSADGYTTKTIQLTEDNMITENTILHYSLGDIRLEKVVEETTHTVSGTVVDANGALAGVTVACSHGTTTTSNASGSYSFALPDGTYTLTFTLDGYETTTRTVTVNGSDCSVDVVTMATVEDENIVASGECGDNLTWKLDTDGTLTISGTGDMWDYEYASSPWYSYNSSIERIIVEEGVTRIGSYAFYRVSLYRTSSDHSLISLPSTLLSIGSYAFEYSTYSAPLYLPENLKIIEYNAFDHSDFTEIYIPASVEKIGYIEYETNIDDKTRNVFSSCYDLTQIVVDEANPYFCSEDGVLFTKSKDTLITYPEGKTDDTYVMPNNVSSVIDDAFGEFNSNVCLKKLTISASMETLSSLIMYKNFECFNVDVNSPYFCAVDGVIYSKDKTRIELYPNCNTAYTYDILDGTDVIASYAFCYCDYLLTINIPESVTTIESHAIYGCPCINNLVIPSQVTRFYIDFSCNNLTKIYFMGDAPIIDFASTRESPTLYCIEGKEGWTVPTWDSHSQVYNTAYFDPDTVNLNTIATGTCGNSITWRIDNEGVISFRGSGPMEDYRTYVSSKYGYAPWDKFRKTLRKIIIGEGITTVGEYAFDQCGFIEKVSLPSSVTNIKEYAFSDCTSLKSIFIPNGVVEIGSRVFYGCDNLAEIHIASSVNCLKYMALYPINEYAHLYFYGDVPGQWANCVLNYNRDYTIYYIEGKSGWTTPTWTAPDGFTYTTATFDPDSVTIEPNDPLPPAEIIASGECGMNGDNVTWTLDDSYALTVTGTGEMADYSYTSDNLAPWSSYRDQITSITIGEGITDTGEFTFYCCKNVPGEITIPYGVTTLGKCSFEGLEKVTSYNIPSTVQQIDGFVFKNNTNLQTLTIPDGVTSIGEETFLGCQNLTHVDIPEGVTSIGYSAFYDCYALSSITLPDSLTSVGNTAFWNTGLTGTLYIPKNISSIGYNAFYCNYSLEAFEVDPANTLLMSQDGVLYTHDQTELIQYPRGKTDESYTIPSGVTVIGRLGMAQNGNIKAVTLPETLVEIGEYAFWNSGLTSITLPASLTKLGSRSFEYCGNLTDIYFCGDVPETCGENVATSCNSALTLHYIEGKSGWTTPTWTSPDGKVYNTAVWNP